MLTQKVESIQTEAARNVTGGTRLTSISSLYNEIGWEKLTDRRKFHKLTYFYKMVNNLTPDYLSSILPNQFQNIHGYNTRRASAFQPLMTRTVLYSNYFLPSTVRSWNTLTTTTQSQPTLSSFKNQVKTIRREIPSYYYKGSRIGQILHSRLRMKCSSLNQHLFNKNLVQSPLCECGEIESNEHFLLKCPIYNDNRRRHLNQIGTIANSVNILLFGSINLTSEQNEMIFESVQSYIVSSKPHTSPHPPGLCALIYFTHCTKCTYL